VKNSNIIIGVVAGVGCLGMMVCVGVIGVGLISFYRAVDMAERGGPMAFDEQVEDLELQTEDYAEARKTFQTKLISTGPSPQPAPPTIQIPPDIQTVKYSSGGLQLTAYVDPAPADGGQRPAVLFLHGGFAFGDDDLVMPQPFRDAGYIVMVPVLRGENGQPGNFTLYYDEVEDVLGAAESLAALPYVDPNRIFLAGHSAGAVLTQLASMTSKKFVGAASFSGLCNEHTQTDWSLIRFDMASEAEYEMRSSQAYATSFKCPIRLYYGSQEGWIAGQTRTTVDRGKQAGIDIAYEVVPGDHMSCVPESIRRSIEFFKTLEE
jgi:dienelactone hydrolase